MALTFTDVKKEGQYFVFTTQERKNPIKFDCINGTFITPRKVFPAWEVPESFMSGWYYGSNFEVSDYNLPYILVRALRDGFHYYGLRNFGGIEKMKQLVSYLETIYANKDLLNNNGFSTEFKDLTEFPRGLFKWLRIENKPLTKQNLLLFKLKDYRKNPKIAVLLEDACEQYDLTNFVNLDFKTLSDLAQVHSVFKKDFQWNAQGVFRNFYYDLFFSYKNMLLPDIDKWLDKNRGYEYNLELARAYVNRERNEKILANENKIRDIEKLETENLCIKVPSTINDFTEEGKMQNNCVGSYYHDDIANKHDLIYFIRRKENRAHSYVTCRFHLEDEYKTVEYRVVNNRDVKDNETLAFIKQIDQKIKILLEKG